MVRQFLTGAASIALMAIPAPALAQTMSADEAAALRAELAALRAQVDALEARLGTVTSPAPVPAPVPSVSPTPAPAPAPSTETSWRGAPQFRQGDWSFKPRGRIHFDAGHVSIPGDLATTRNLGTNVRFRRVRLGAEGTMPGGFGYKLEADFAGGNVTLADAFLSYDASDSVQLRLGNFETLDGMEQISSSNNISFIERAAFNDAFLNSRRFGAAAAWQTDSWRAEAGLFAAHQLDSSFDNNGYIAAGRLAYTPAIGDGGRLHLAVNAQWREFASNTGGTPTAGNNAPSQAQLARYRARPNSQLTDVRFVDTGSFAARSDRIVGLEAAAILPGFYASAEAQWLRSSSYRPGSIATGLNAFAGANTAVVTTSNPEFFGVYGEIGWFITGETRGYRDGTWARTRALRPVDRGGPGAWMLAARVDHLDLNNAALIAGATNDFATGTTSLAPIATRLGRGGTQTSYLLALNWTPIDYIRLMLNYGRIEVEGGPLAGLVRPLSTAPVNERSYSVDLLAARMQLEF
jgi:phosphate-selective porin OprO and OprP